MTKGYLRTGYGGVGMNAAKPATDLRDRIAAILHAHTLAENDPVFWRCCCTAYSDSFKDDYIAHDAHVADAVIEALPELNPDHVRAKYLKDWEEGYDEGYSAGGGGC